MWKSLALSAALASAAACNSVSYVNPRTTPSSLVASQTGHFFLWGLVGHTDVWANRMCPRGVSRVHSEFSFGDEVLTVITAGLYAPRSYQIGCAQ